MGGEKKKRGEVGAARGKKDSHLRTHRPTEEGGGESSHSWSIHTHNTCGGYLRVKVQIGGGGDPLFFVLKKPRLVIPFRVGKGEMARGDYIGGGEGSSNNNPFLFPADHKGKKPKFMQDIFRMNESGKTPQFEWKTWDQRGANYSREKKKPNGFFVRSIVHPCQPTLWYVICCTCHPPPCAPEHKRGISRGENMQRKRG